MQLKELTTPQNVLVPPPTRLHKMKGPPITYFGKYGLPKPFRPLSRTRHALQVSLFFKIPRELRNEIYALVVVSKDKLHLTKDHVCQYDQFYFQICPAAFMNEYGECECESDLRSRTARFLDTSLLMVSQQIRTETLTVLFARNIFHLWEIMLHSLIITFSKFVGSIRNISVKMFLGSQIASAATRQIQRSSWKALSSLHRLTIYVQLEERGNEHYEEGILNNFRPLAFLPLDVAEVRCRIPSASDDDRKTVSRLEARARAILLRDPSLPEEPQTQPGPASAILEGEREHNKRDFVPGLISGKM